MNIKEELLVYVNGGINTVLIKRYSICAAIGLGVALLTIVGFVGLVLWVDSKKKSQMYSLSNNSTD